MTRLLAAVVLFCATSASGCASRGPRSPERLRDAHLAALEANDAAAAYALLAPDVKTTVPYAEFEARWKAHAKERKAAAQAGREVSTSHLGAVHQGTTVHRDGVVLRWVEAGDRYYVVAGLPGAAQTATPAQTIRALIRAVRTIDKSQVRLLLGEELAETIDDDWTGRVEAMEAALDRPGAIELSSDLLRANLRYEATRVLSLEQTPTGWRITRLE